jgi:hypothetical protein
VLPTGPGYTDNYYARDNFESTLHKIDTKVTWTPGNRLNLNNRVSWLTSRQNSHGIFPSLDGAEFNPLSVGRLWQANITSGSVLATSILSRRSWSTVCSATRRITAGSDLRDRKTNAGATTSRSSTPASRRDRVIARPRCSTWAVGGGDAEPDARLRRQPDAVQRQCGLDQRHAQREVRLRLQHNYLNHYETAVPVFTFNGGTTALSGGTAPNTFNQFADFLLGLPQSRTHR